MQKPDASLLLAIGLGVLVALAAAVPFAILGGGAIRPPSPPQVSLTPAALGDFSVSVFVASATRVESLQRYSASLFLDGSPASRIDPLSLQVGAGMSYDDRDVDRRLSPGDSVTVTRLDEGAYRLQLQWQDVPIANATWTVRRPSVNLTQVPGTPLSWVNVTAVDGEYPLSEFGAVITRNGSWWDQLDPLRAGASSQGHFSFEDRDLDLLLSPGDGFEVSTPSGWYALSLFWRTGNVSFASWTV